MTTLIEARTIDAATEVLRKIVAKTEGRGEKNLIFCEDKLTLICERAILSALCGAFHTEVTTFARFLSGPGVISKQGSVMLVSSIIEENREKLSCFHERSAAAVYETIAQLNASRIDAELLEKSAEGTDGLLQRKLCDLSLIFSLYRQKLREGGYLDESEYLSLLPEKIQSTYLQDTNVFFFCFPSFTKQAQEGIEAALLSAKSVTGIFLSSRESFYTHESRDVFLKICDRAGTPPRMLIAEDPNVFGPLSEALFSSELAKEKLRTERIRRFSAADEQEEIEIVCSLIKREIEKGRRFRDIAVLVPGKERFVGIEKCFRAFRIPFYADKKRAFSEHPFCRFALAVLNAAADGVLPEDADEIASSFYFGEDGCEYRNYLLKYGGYRGAVRREIKDGDAIKDYDVRALSSCRERMLQILSLFPRRGKGKEYVSAVKALLSLVSAEEKTEKLKESFSGAEREFLDLKPIFDILNEMLFLAGERTFSAREFYDELLSGLSALEISMIPQSLDSVFVGDLVESKFERVKVLFVVGLTDEIPRVSVDSALITDGEMEKLDQLKVEIEPKIEQVNARAREGLALNLCAFEDALYLSYPLQKGGEPMERSEIYKDIEQRFEMPPMPALFPFDCCEEGPALMRLFKESISTEEKAQHDALYELLKEEYGESFLERLLSGNKKERIQNAAPPDHVSPTLLEKYFECPYSSFVSRILRLKEREERAILDTDTGNFVHAVLEKCSNEFEEISSPETCRSRAREIGEELLSSPRYLSLKDTPQGIYAAERLLKEGEEVCTAAWLQVVCSLFHVKRTEEDITLPEIKLKGKPDRIDWSEEYIRVIDYKTGAIDDQPAAYYTGRKLQLELYLKAACENSLKPAGAFYFPASERFVREDEEKYRLRGFFCEEEDVLLTMDTSLRETGKSRFFDGKLDGRRTGKGMNREDFQAFLDYSVLLASRAEHEMQEGVIEPSPYEGSCTYCKLKSLCGFIGEPRNEAGINCKEIACIVKREKGEL